MKKLLTFILVMSLVLGLPLFAGGGASTVSDSVGLFETAAWAFDNDEMDVFPCFFGVDNGGPDEGWMVFYDQDANAFQAPRLIDNDLLDGQWTPQRNAIGWDTTGKYNVSFIEESGNNLEIWESPDDSWQDDAGAWTLTDSDASNAWGAIDVETRQNYIWSVLEIPAADVICAFIDLSAGVPNWILLTASAIVIDGGNYSIVLDNNLAGYIHWGYVATNVTYRPISVGDIFYPAFVVNLGGDSPQLITDMENRIWYFYTASNTLILESSFDQPLGPVFDLDGIAPVYTANELDDDYHVTWLAGANTIHVALVDRDTGNPNATFLIYLRRTPNGWSAPVTLLTVDGAVIGDADDLLWPQITVDPIGSIFIYYIYDDDHTLPGNEDLQGFHLDFTDYDDFATPATWTQYTDIDDSSDDIIWCVAPDSVPVASDI